MKTMTVLTNLILALLYSPRALATLHHRLDIALAPAVKSLFVTDQISALSTRRLRFLLNKNLQVRVLSQGDQIRQLPSPARDLYHEYELQLGSNDQEVTLQYSGILFDPVNNNESSGLISIVGAVLFGSTYWLPDFSEVATFEILKTQMPADWKLASPNQQTQIPQKEIYLIAGAFHEYLLENNPTGIPLKVYLRNPEPSLAQTFLNLLPGYLDHYQKTLGGFPYQSFAVIENFWETGFGMPAFTLLGPGVIRLPYILNSSLPHELLHNWWGNSVYVDYERGNWCEGLTTYLADHWQQEVLKADRDYRRQSLINFQDYTKLTTDFPLREFKQRFNFSSQAVGYGKGMMFFHMLRKQLREGPFSQALKDLYQNHRSQSISYEEIEKSFSHTTGADLKSYFKQWLDRTGAPTLTLSQAKQMPLAADTNEVSFELGQVSPQIYELLVPVRFNFKNGTQKNEMLRLQEAHQTFKFRFSGALKNLEIDPEVDIFRSLDINERPMGFSNLFGAGPMWILGSDDATKKAFQQTWQNSLESPITLGDDKLLLDLPREGAVVLLGDSPEYEKWILLELRGQDFSIGPEQVTLFGHSYLKKENKIALVARSSTHPGLIFAWIRGSNIETLAPRLLHYGKFGVLVFAETSVALKTTWPLLNSPLKVEF